VTPKPKGKPAKLSATVSGDMTSPWLGVRQYEKRRDCATQALSGKAGDSSRRRRRGEMGSIWGVDRRVSWKDE
jgi:hypothetical protein